VESVLNFLKRFGLGRFAAIAGAVAGAIAVLAGVMLKAGAEPEALLYANLDLKEASQITGALDQAGIKYQVKGDGSTIMVPRDSVASTRLMLSSKGLPTSGSVGYEIFDNASALGQTDFVQNLNRQRALEGELARTIRSLRGVTSARVHLVLPKRQLFEEEAGSPTASIVVGLGGRDLSADQVRSLRNLVAGAVPNLKPDRVTVVDESGKMLAAGSPDGDVSLDSQAANDRKAQVEEHIRRAVKDVVEGVVGPGKARVQVTADIDMTQMTTQKEAYDPDGAVVLSTTTMAEKHNQADNNGGGTTGAAANIPGQNVNNPVNGTNSDTSDHNDETTNYDVSKTTTTTIQVPGAVKKLSVAVAVDGVTAEGKGDKPGAYSPRNAEDMKRIEELVRTAMGFDQTRGDQLSVVNVRFERQADGIGGTPAGPPLLDFDKNDMMRCAELLILGIVAVLMIFFVVRPLLRSTTGGGFPGFGTPALAAAGAGAAASGATPLLATSAPGAAGPPALTGDAQALALQPTEVEQRIDIARIEGQVKASSIKKVADFVDNHPEESISILRSWLHES
jgi:flagellar M-ring protein FliF